MHDDRHAASATAIVVALDSSTEKTSRMACVITTGQSRLRFCASAMYFSSPKHVEDGDAAVGRGGDAAAVVVAAACCAY